ncbi:MAG: hypothetical protein ABMB14_05570 [Myxococcota bacterium]
MAEKKRFLLRIDAQLYAALERWAADDLRSVNGQLEYLLGDAVRKAGRARGVEPARGAPAATESTEASGDSDEPDSPLDRSGLDSSETAPPSRATVK